MVTGIVYGVPNGGSVAVDFDGFAISLATLYGLPLEPPLHLLFGRFGSDFVVYPSTFAVGFFYI